MGLQLRTDSNVGMHMCTILTAVGLLHWATRHTYTPTEEINNDNNRESLGLINYFIPMQ